MNYSPSGAFAAGQSCDFDADGDVDATDFAHLMGCAANGPDMSPPADDGQTPTPVACEDAQGRIDTDLDGDGDVDGADVALCQPCMSGDGHAPPGFCAGGRLPDSGTFTLHGRPIEVLDGGLTLMPVRARVYDPRHARWLQRDPLGYVDGPSHEKGSSLVFMNSDDSE